MATNVTTNIQQPLIPRLLIGETGGFGRSAAAVGLGIILISLLAQVAIPLPWTPVPITGQTFGVMLVALLWGWRLGLPVVAAYLAAGAIGAPVFAMAKSGITFGPTIGYLAGMFIASGVVGYLSERGWTSSFWKSYAACVVGSVIVFACGLAVLSYFVPAGSGLLAAGLYPFIPGDLVKSLAAAAIASSGNRIKT